MAFTHRSVLAKIVRILNEVISFVIFCILDIVDFILCYTYKVIDFLVEAEWKSCYCSSAKEVVTGIGKILVSERSGEPKIVRLSSTKLQLEEISDTLYTRPSLVSQLISKSSTVKRLVKAKKKKIVKNGAATTVRSNTFTVNSTVVEMLQLPKNIITPRWSDCDCSTCNSWAVSSNCFDTLYVKADGAIDNVEEDVIFIHGFISSSGFWTETLFPNFTDSAKTKYRLIAFDLLGFGRSPKPNDSLYTLREHVEMIESSVIEAYKVKSFHIVAHSLGCILALALAVKHHGSIKSLTLIAPPYFPVTKGSGSGLGSGSGSVEGATQYMLRRVAPRRIWPLLSFGVSIGCWYEHISRTICLCICKNHKIWEFIAKLLTRNRIRTYLMEGFWCHTHAAAWHTLHNIICGTASKIEGYLDVVNNKMMQCNVTIYHGMDDQVIPLKCTSNLQTRIPRAQVKLIPNKDHLTIVVGRQKSFAKELQLIWSA